MPHDGKQIANHIIAIAAERGNTLDIMTLLKLSYFAHGWCLARLDHALVTDPVEAWKYGPVIPSVYYGFRPRGIDNLRPLDLIPVEIDDPEQRIMRFVYESYGSLNGGRLSRLTHKKGGPWHEIYRSRGSGSVIPNDLIMKYYKGAGDGHARISDS